MIRVVNEPVTLYKVASWQKGLKGFLIEDFICGIENGTVLFCPPSSQSYMFFFQKPKRKLSALRGKLTKQNKNEIDDQISNLRSEWERNF